MARGAIFLTASALALALLAGCGRGEVEADSAAAPAREVAATPGAAASDGPTLKAVRARGRLNCGVSQNRPGFATRDMLGQWRGFDVDFCRAVAAAVLGDARQVRFTAVDAGERFSALQAEQIDLIARAGLSFTRDAGRGLDPVGISFYDDQAFLVSRALENQTPADLAGRTVCVQAGSPAELGMVEFFETQKSKPKSLVTDSEDEAVEAYAARRCEALNGDRATLAAIRSTLRIPADHVILEQALAKDPQGPYVRQGDSQWADIVRWTLNAMILAEEQGVSSRTVNEDRESPKRREVGRLLAGDGYGRMLLLRDDWAFQVIRQVGNYGEVFDRNLGPNTSLRMERGPNALAAADPPGMVYALPMR